MHHTKRQQLVAAISLCFMTVFLSVLQPIPPASAQLLTKPISQETDGTGTQGKRHGNIAGGYRYPTNPIEKMDAKTSTSRSHRLIRKPQNLPLASVEPSPSDSSSVNSVPSSSLSRYRYGAAAQSEEPSVPRTSIGAAVQLPPISVTPSAAAPTGFTATGTTPTSTIPLAAAGIGNPTSSGSGNAGGRGMRRLSSEISEVVQLVSPSLAPTLSSSPVTGGPAIGISQTSLSFTAQQGETSPATQILTINNTGHGILNWTATNSATWLTLSPTSGTGAAVVTANVLAGALAPGSYSETITLSASGASPVTIPVSFTVTAAPVPPAISMTPASLSFTAQQGGSNPPAQTLTISNTGSSALSWGVSHDATWLWHTPGKGTGAGTVTISVIPGSLLAGTYNGQVSLWPNGATPVTIPVSFTVTAAPVPPTISASPTTLAFTAIQGGSNPAAQILSISNTGGGTLNWSASETTGWLALTTSSGSGNGTMTLQATTGALAPGTHTGAVTLSGGTGVTPVTIPVSFTVTAAPAIRISPASLSFTAQQGSSSPAAQTLAISNSGGGTLSWSVSHDATWLGHTPGTGTGTGTVSISVVTGSLTVGTHNGQVTFWPSGSTASPITIPVSFTVAAVPVPPAIGVSSTSLSFTATQGGASPAAQTLNISNTGGGTLSWSVSHDATWLWHTPGKGTGTGPVTISVTTGSLMAGTHSGQVTFWPAGSTATPVTIPVIFTVTPAPAPPAIGVSPTSLSFTVQEGGNNPPAQTLAVTNKGSSTLTWSVTGNSSWISPSPISGTGNSGTTISVTTGFLKAGTYNGVVTLNATGATAVTVPVAFTVTPSATTASTTINVNPSSLSYVATQGAANPTNQNISLTTTGGTVNWTVSDNASWLAVNLTSGSGSRTLTTSVNTAGLTVGAYNGTLTVSATGISSKTVAVTLTVNPPATSSATMAWAANTESDLAGYKVYRATNSGGYGAPIATLPGNVTTYMATGLQLGTTYFFVITAYDLAGNESPRSNEISKSIF